MSSSAFNSQIIPKELLKFRLDKQLGRLKQVIESKNEKIRTEFEEEEDKFQLYQRVLSWFIMGRLAKSEYDGILENILITTELIELHNKVIELLRAIYCDSSSILVTSGSAVEIDSKTSSSSLDSFLNSFELNLLPPEELKIEENETEDTEAKSICAAYADETEKSSEFDEEIVVFNAFLSTRKFNTSIANLGLTASEEALISEAMRNPIHDIASNERDVLIPGINYKKGFDVNFDCGSAMCTEISSLPNQNVMKSRFIKVAKSTFDDPSPFSTMTPTISDSISILACKSLEDYMKNLLENVATVKFGHQSLLRPPISYIFPNVPEGNEGKTTGKEVEKTEKLRITEKDLNLLFKLKPWLLADMEAEVVDELFK